MQTMLKKVLTFCSMIALAGAAACASMDGGAGDAGWSQQPTTIQLGDSQGA